MERLLLHGLLLVLTIVFFKNLYQKLKKTIELHKYVDAFPGDKWYPIIGTLWRFFGVKREDSWVVFKQLGKQYGPTWRLWNGSIPSLLLSEAEHLEIIFKHPVNINKGMTYKFVEPWLGQGLVTVDRSKWKVNRRLLTPAFHFQILDKYSEVFSRKSQELVNVFEQKVGEYVDIFPFLTRCGLDIITETAMGVKFDTLKDPDCDYANAIFKLCEVASKRTRSFLDKSDFIFKFTELGRDQEKCLRIVKDTNMKIIAERKKEWQKHNQHSKIDDLGRKEKMAFLDLLLETQEESNFTDKEICDEVSTFMFAGQDTTAATVTYSILALGNHPEIQEKAHAELDNIFSGEERPITPQDLADMEYLDRVIKETLRKFSIVPVVGRTLEEAIVIDGKTVPPGVNVQLCIFRVHNDPKHWTNPEKYDPDRFLPENSANRHPYAFVPFSAGPRNCIGQKFGTRNSKTMLASVLRKFKFTCLETIDDLKEYNEVVLKPQNGVHVKFELRNKKS